MAATTRGRALTEYQRAQQLAIRARLLADLIDLWRLLDPERVDQTVGAWLGQALETVIRHRQRSARSAVEYYGELRRAEIGGPVEQPATPEITQATRARIASSLIVTGPTEIRARLAMGQTPDVAAEAALTAVQGSAGRHALNGGRQALASAGEEDRRVVAYARVTAAKPCWFCTMLSSRGFVYRSKAAAGARRNRAFQGDGLYKFHDFCACTVEPVFREDSPKTAHALAHEALWARATRGLGGERARLAFRRAVEGRPLPDDPINRG
jgi:hypothetical protein